MKLKKLVGMFICLLLGLALKAQVAVSFSPTLFGQSLEGLGLAQLVSSFTSNKQVTVTVNVTHMNFGQVVVVRVPAFLLKPGVNPINRVEYSKASLQFGNSVIVSQLKQTGRFAEGEYEICYTVTTSEKGGDVETFENCFPSMIQPATPLLLINPIDGDQICNTRPQFVWQSPMPFTRDMRFGLQLCELRDKQNREEAIVNNIPLLAQYNIPVSTFAYPPTLKELSKDKKYIWQVTVYSGKTILSKSEIWDFKIDCNELPAKEPSFESYRELKETDDGNYYVAHGILRFSFNNPYSGGFLNYSISPMITPENAVKKLPEFKVNAGLNKYDLDLGGYKSFKDGEEYLLTVYLKSDRVLKLRFLYKTE